MKIKQRKLTAFLMAWISLNVTAILTIYHAPESWASYGKWFVIGICVTSFAFISFRVVTDYIKSRWYNEKLDDNINGGR